MNEKLTFEQALAALAEGKRLLRRSRPCDAVELWRPVHTSGPCITLNKTDQYMLAPEPIRYRRYIRRPPKDWGCGAVVWTVHEKELKAYGGPEEFAKQPGLFFVRWLDNDWQEAEV